MVKQYRDSLWLIAGGYVILALLIWLVLMREFRLDDSFITYRYARNVARGIGLVYNPNEMVLSTTAPLYALLLAVLSFIINDFHILGGLVGTICIGIGGALIFALLPKTMPFAIRGWAGLIYVLSSPLWLALGMETPLWIMLVLAGVLLSRENRWWQAGLVIGLAILTRPDAALPGVLIGLTALGLSINSLGTQSRWWRPVTEYSLAAGIPVVLFFVWAWATYGSPFPATLSAKGAQATLGITGFGVFVNAWDGLWLILESLLRQSLLYIVFLPLILLGFSRKLSPSVILIVVWGVLHLIAYMLLGVAPYRWYYVPLLPTVILLAAYGLARFYESKAKTGFALAVGVLLAVLPIAAQATSFVKIAEYFQQGGERETMLPIVDWQAYREAGEWLNANAAPDEVVGVAEVGQLGFYADRYMTDYLGLLQPDVADLVERGDLYSWMVGYAPDYLVFQRFGGNVGLALYNYFIEFDPWFNANYGEVAKFEDTRYVLGPVVIYRRRHPIQKLPETQTIAADFGPIRLNGIATDIQDRESGATRVRLDWHVAGELPQSLHIAIAVLDAPVEIKFDGDYDTQKWPNELSTWHTLIVPSNVPPADYPLLVSVGLINGGFVPVPVGHLKIPSEDDDAP